MNLKEAIRDVLGVREQPGDEWQCFCFSPEHDNRNTPSASVNVRKGLWVCYSCGRGGSVLRLLEGDVQLSDPSVSEFLSDVERDLDRLQQDGELSTKPERWLSLFLQREPHPEWLRRFSREAIDYFLLGYDYETDCLTYPLRDVDGSVLGVVRRRLDGGKPKYIYPKGVDVHQLLFRYHEARYGEDVVLVEGALDSVALWEAGIFAMAIYGGHLSAMQASLLRRLNPAHVVCAFDNDDAGRDLLDDVRQRDDLCGLNLRTVVWDSIIEKDVAELSVVRRRNLISESVDLD